jgi:hypothetical protein
MKRLLVNSLIALALIISSVSFSVMPALAVAPLVSTSSCTGFSSSTAIINGQLTSLNGGGAITSYGFDYGVTIAYGTSVIVGTTLAVGSKYWANLSGLTAATVYHYRAKVYNGTDWGYGSDMTFSTQGTPSSIPATTTTTTTTNNLATITPKNPPIDADKVIYEDSTAGDALVTSTWLQVKAFLKTYFDTVYSAYGATGNVTAKGAVGAIPQFSTTTNITNSIATGNSTFVTVAGGIQATSAQINGATNVVGDVTFNKYKAIAMSCDNGATLPAAPTTGQWFLHTPTGRSILYQYVGAWTPISSFGSITVYVDKTDGTDDINHGTGVDANAFKTIQYAIDLIPDTYSGNVLIYVNGETYNETVNISGKKASGSYSIYIYGTQSSVLAATANGAKATGSGATLGTLIDTTNFGTDYSRKIIKINTTGEYFVIKSADTGTKTITIEGYFADTTNKGYTIYDWVTVINGITLGNSQVNVYFYDIYFNGYAASTAQLTRGSYSLFNRCKLSSTTAFPVLMQSSSAVFNTCYFVASAAYYAGILAAYMSYCNLQKCLIYTGATTINGINCQYMSIVVFNVGLSGIVGTSGTKGNIGAYLTGKSLLTGESLYNRFEEMAYAYYVVDSSTVIFGTNTQKVNITNADVVEAASYSYVN